MMTTLVVGPFYLARALGLDAAVHGVRWREMRDRIFGRIDPISAAGRHYRAERCPHITLHEGHARLLGVSPRARNTNWREARCLNGWSSPR